jgi:DNA-binding response OmpR family regulator
MTGQAAAATAPHRILVVEDDDIIRDTLLDFLDENGYQGIGAQHGQDALEKLREEAASPCLIVLDLMMPVMDGRVFREQQLQDPALSGIPVVVISALRNLEGIVEGMNVEWLAKPLRLHDLLALVRRHCPQS